MDFLETMLDTKNANGYDPGATRRRFFRLQDFAQMLVVKYWNCGKRDPRFFMRLDALRRVGSSGGR